MYLYRKLILASIYIIPSSIEDLKNLRIYSGKIGAKRIRPYNNAHQGNSTVTAKKHTADTMNVLVNFCHILIPILRVIKQT